MDPVTQVVGRRPGKVIAVHLNYPSRAAQRGRVPTKPSYFLKPSSSLNGEGTVERPQGTELLAFEGEIALVIGTEARRVRPEDGWAHVGWVTAANDFGIYDLRAADRGSNVRAKGGDGFTAVGPTLLAAVDVDPAALRVCTWLDGELVQNDTSDTLLFGFGEIIADLSRLLTLEVGDVILTGTPAGASVAQPGQSVEVEVSDLVNERTSGRLRTKVIEGPPLQAWGATASIDDAVRAEAWGTAMPAAHSAAGLEADLRERLGKVAVATLSVQLRKRGFHDSSIDGIRPLAPGHRLVGIARTLRYVAFRPDLFAAHGSGYNAQKRAVDTIRPGEVLVMEARREPMAGTLGDILALRAKIRGAAGIITDGAVRDAAAVADTGLPVYAGGQHPAVLGRRHVPWETDVTITCGGATVQVGDVIVADDDGVVVIPPGLLIELLTDAELQEREEAWISARVRQGAGLDGLYPLSGEWRRRYDDEVTRGAESAP